MPSPPPLDSTLVLTTDALCNLLKVTTPDGAVTVKGIASEVNVWTKPGEDQATRVYGRLGLGESTIRFELPPQASLQNNSPVVLHGTLRIKPLKTFRATHEVVLIGDVVGSWTPREEAPSEPAISLARTNPRTALETVIARNGLEGIAFLATRTAWQDLTNAASSLPALANALHIETNFMQPRQFIRDLQALSRNTNVKALVVARGGGDGIETIGDSPVVAEALLATGHPFYTALGHDKDVLLLDKHADQAFSTPSIFGQALAAAVRVCVERESQVKRESEFRQGYDRATSEIAQLRRQVAQLSATPKAQPSSPSGRKPEWASRVPIAAWIALLAVVFLLGKCSH